MLLTHDNGTKFQMNIKQTADTNFADIFLDFVFFFNSFPPLIFTF